MKKYYADLKVSYGNAKQYKFIDTATCTKAKGRKSNYMIVPSKRTTVTMEKNCLLPYPKKKKEKKKESDWEKQEREKKKMKRRGRKKKGERRKKTRKRRKRRMMTPTMMMMKMKVMMAIRKTLTTNLGRFPTQSSQVLTVMMMETTTKRRRRRKRKRMKTPMMETPMMEMILKTLTTCLDLFLTQSSHNYDSNYFKKD